ncbi:MAG: HPr family phosphocarrier protein [Vicinamibacteria bacterium]
MVERRVGIMNPLGLHARAAAQFVRTATQFSSKVTVSKDGTTIDGKSILGILFLAATSGSELTIAATGADEDEAVDALVKLVASGFGEGT